MSFTTNLLKMKKRLLSLLLISSLVVHSQNVKAYFGVEKYKDQYDNSYYPIVWTDFSYTFNDSITSLQFTYWSNTNGYISPYINLNLNWRGWQISYNPLKPDIYNYKIYITHYFNLWK